MTPEDKYKNFQELSKNHKRDVDYRIEACDRASPFSVLAIHGGKTEPMTAEIARAIAGNDLNYYVFETLQQQAWDLHVTSNNYDEPAAVDMAGKSRACISIHGFKESHKRQVCIGGQNVKLKNLIFQNLQKTGLLEQTTENPFTDKFYAEDKANIVNRCIEGGVQIEISRALRDLLRHDPEKMKVFASAIRQSISDYAAPAPPRNPKPKMGPF
jgi:phage replication-related protein YjqB (UPF0714/DUF867 family)